MKTKLIFLIFSLSGVMTLLFGRSTHYGEKVKQIDVNRIEMMPNLPNTYKIINWKEQAINYDSYVFDFNSRMPAGSMIWIDNNMRNIPQQTFGLYTAVNDCRQGQKNNNGEFHESLNTIVAVLGSGLVGIDKTNQHGFNFVKMLQNYFNSDNGWNIIMNNTTSSVGLLGGGYGRDWWYDVLPNLLYYAVCDIFPNVENADNIQLKIAEQFCKSDSILNGNYDYSYFDYAQMKGMVNHIPFQQDASGGHGWVLYAAYQKFGDIRYLRHAKSAINVLNNQSESRFYEILLPMGIYTAARLNAEQGTSYNLTKMLDWTFEGCKSPKGRNGWGVIVGKWGNYEVNGLQGSIIDGGGYAFLMNSMKMAWPLVPMVKYAPRYARAIGKWMLNNVNSARLFFPDQIADENQWLPEMKYLTKSVVAYEGLRYEDCYNKPALKGVHPVALGDGPNWNKNNPKETMFSLYSTSPVGIFGAMVDTTNVAGILKLNCNVTDFYANTPYPVYLLYNPHSTIKVINYDTDRAADLFDIVNKRYLSRNKVQSSFEINPDEAVLIVELPAGSKIKKSGIQLIVDGNVISH